MVVDNCAICRNHIMDACIECQASMSAPGGDDCNVAWGVCNHAFHSHCISYVVPFFWLSLSQNASELSSNSCSNLCDHYI